MTRYWLDANIFIEAKNGPYGFDLAPGFWECLEQNARAGSLRSPMMVYHELVSSIAGEDELAAWARKARSFGLFIDPSQPVQQAFGQIADFVQARYQPAQAAEFLRGADAWVIAHAEVDGGIVVTREKLVASNSFKIKIPNLCKQFTVPYVDTFEMLRELNVSLVLGSSRSISH